jgi:probable selenium-dependent hydroxylase accessory protein YqeC
MANSKAGLPNSWASGSLWDMTRRVQVVTFIGAGGKTTCLRSITQEIDAAGQRVIATTTTKVFPEESMKGWKNANPPPYEQKGACFWYVDVMEENGKWIGPPLKAVDDAIYEDFSFVKEQGIHAGVHREITHGALGSSKRFWVIEGDGARGLKLKCRWEPYEPQIPQRSGCIVLVLDGGLWGKVLQTEQVHRPAGCLDLLGHVWNAEKAWRYFLRSPVFAPQYRQMSWVILLNAKAFRDSVKLLLELNHRWTEIQREIIELKYRPNHLRLAAGDAKEGKLQWFDLW